MTAPIRKPLIWALVLINIVFLIVIIRLTPRTVGGLMHTRSAELPKLASLEPFALTREDGTDFASDKLDGHAWVASFIFTRCPDQCPLMSTRFALIQKTMPAGPKLVSFSVDPGHDKPDVLKSYADRFGADPARWIFLTGDPGVIGRIQSQLKLGDGDEPSMHSLRFVLLDGQRIVRGYYDSEDPATPGRIVKDLKKLEKK